METGIEIHRGRRNNTNPHQVCVHRSLLVLFGVRAWKDGSPPDESGSSDGLRIDDDAEDLPCPVDSDSSVHVPANKS